MKIVPRKVSFERFALLLNKYYKYLKNATVIKPSPIIGIYNYMFT